MKILKDRDRATLQGLIFLAIVCQFMSGVNFYSLNHYLNLSDVFFGNQLDSRYWVVACFFGRLLGVVIIGKYAERFGFFRSMQVISGFFVSFSVLFALFCLIPDACAIDERFYFFRLCYCFLQPAALFLPCIYLFENIPASYHLGGGAILVFGVFIGEVGAYGLKFIQTQYPIGWTIIPVLTTLIAWGIYGYLQKTSKTFVKNLSTKDEIEAKTQAEPGPEPQLEAEGLNLEGVEIKGVGEMKLLTKSMMTYIPLKVKILSFFIGAASATAVFYNHTFLSHYMLDVVVINPQFNFSGISFYVLWAICLIPGIKLTQYFGFLKVACLSLIVMVILTFNPLFFYFPLVMYTVCQILLAIGSAFFMAPLLAGLDELYTPYPSPFQRMFWYVLGFSTCILLAFFEKAFTLRYGFRGLGWCVFNASLGLCLVGLLFEGNSGGNKGMLADHAKPTG